MLTTALILLQNERFFPASINMSEPYDACTVYAAFFRIMHAPAAQGHYESVSDFRLLSLATCRNWLRRLYLVKVK